MPVTRDLRSTATLGVALALLLVIASPLAAQSRGLTVAAAPVTGNTTVIGRQIAVLIAIDRYREWLTLRRPVADARALGEILTRRYYIDEVIELYNEKATRADIVRLLDRLARETRPEDSIIIYYAGHGYLDTRSNTGSWIPYDAGVDLDNKQGWLSHEEVKGFIARMQPRHVLLVSDSCFSGNILTLSRGAFPIIDSEYFRRAYARRSRQVLSSGSIEEVPDSSSFSSALLRTLEENREPYLDPYMLFADIRLSVTDTTPLLGSLKDTESQEGGSHILFLKERPPVPTAQAPKVPPRQEVPSPKRLIPGKLILPSMPVEVGLRSGGVPLDPDAVPAGLDLTVEFVSSRAISLGIEPLRLKIGEGEVLNLSLPSGRFGLTRVPKGSVVSVGSAELPGAMYDRESGSYLSPELPVGEYEVAVAGPVPYTGRVSIRIGKVAELPGYREAVSASLASLSARKEALEGRIRAIPRRKAAGTLSLVAGIAGAAGSAVSYFLGQQAYEAYLGAGSTKAAEAAKARMELFGTMLPAAAVVGGLGVVLTPIFLLGNETNALEESIQALDENIRRFTGK